MIERSSTYDSAYLSNEISKFNNNEDDNNALDDNQLEAIK